MHERTTASSTSTLHAPHWPSPQPTPEQTKDALAGNLCRCGTHQRILRAVMRASGRPQP